MSMPNSSRHDESVNVEDLEFDAEQELVTIVPNFSLKREGAYGKLSLMDREYGPFQPNIPLKVPLWLAIFLRKRSKCVIQPPDWLALDRLQQVLMEEKDGAGLVALPEYYIQISKLLFQHAEKDFGPNEKRIRETLNEIRVARWEKINKIISQPEMWKDAGPNRSIFGLAAGERMTIRSKMLGFLDRYYFQRTHEEQGRNEFYGVAAGQGAGNAAGAPGADRREAQGAAAAAAGQPAQRRRELRRR